MAIKKAFEIITEKRCTKCGVIKMIDFFVRIKATDRRDSWCKQCHSYAANAAYSSNRTSTFDNALCHVFLGVKTTSFTKQSSYKV